MEISRIAFEQLRNTRDLGQFSTMDGQHIRPRHLLRSGNLHNLSLEDRAILQNDYQLRTVIDFRTETERSGQPDTKIHGVTYHWVPILDEATMGITRPDEGGADGLAQLAALLRDKQFDAKQYMMDTYRQLVLSSHSRSQYRKFFQILLEAPADGAVLWHCSAGKDRVGIGTFFLLRVLGVSEEIAADDFLATNTFQADSLNKMVTLMVEKTGSKDIIPKLDAMFSVSPDYLDAVRDEIRTKFGGLDAFLVQEMGLDSDKQAALREKYLLKS